LRKKGQSFVDVDILQTGDPNVKVQDLEDARRELISLSGVPAPYLGFQDVVDLREQLINVNITFATEISTIQGVVSDGINEICNKVVGNYMKNFRTNNYINLEFNPPIILMLQLLETTSSSVGNILQTLSTIPGLKIDPLFLLKQYIPYMDWDAFENAGNKFVNNMKAQQ
jgi:hypothetical protein